MWHPRRREPTEPLNPRTDGHKSTVAALYRFETLCFAGHSLHDAFTLADTNTPLDKLIPWDAFLYIAEDAS